MNKKIRLSPYLLILLSFAGLIVLGGILLSLPFSYQNYDSSEHNFLNALFTSASAVCVTGLSVFQDINVTFSIFGKIVILLLIQIGGLGFITFFVFFLTVFGVKIGIMDRYVIKETLNLSKLSGVLKFVKKIVFFSLIIELIGVIPNLIIFLGYYDNFFTALGVAIFHSVSSFNNAGIDIFGANSMINFSTDIALNITTMIMIILGGLGFFVLIEIFSKKRPKYWSAYTKIVLSMTGFLIIFGTLGFFFLEFGKITFLEALFQSVSLRTTGFSTVMYNDFSVPSKLLMSLLMFIGAAPISTGGGIKVTTIFVIFTTVFCFFRGKKVGAFKRQFSYQTIIKAFALAFFGILLVSISFFTLTIIERNGLLASGKADTLDIFFDTISAFSTTGYMTGFTSLYHPASKVIFAVIMFFGRVGPITIISVFASRMKVTEAQHVNYIEENIIIG